jgi:hypothetical protein
MSNKSQKISKAFENYLQMIDRENFLLEDYLSMHSEFEQELKELINLRNSIIGQKNISPSKKFLENAHARITHRLIDRPVTFSEYIRHILSKKPYRHNRRFSMSQFLATLILLITLATGGVYAADAAGPGDILYGLDRAIDQVKLIFISDPDIVASTRLMYAAERLEEAKNRIEIEDVDSALIALKSYDHEIDKLAQLLASSEGLDRERLSAMIDETLAIHQAILTALLERVPEQAHEAIANAINVSKLNIDILLAPPAETTPVDIPPAPPVEIPVLPPDDTLPLEELPPVEEIPPALPVEPTQIPPEDIPPTPPVETPDLPIDGMP